jgi:hypothetical protein
MCIIGDIIAYFKNIDNLITIALDLFVIPIIIFIEATTSGKVFASISNFRRWYVMAKDPGFVLNIELNNKIDSISYQELNQRLSNSLSQIPVGTICTQGEVLRFRKKFDSFDANFEIHLNLEDDIAQGEFEGSDESNDMYESFLILVDINNLNLSKIKRVLGEIQTFIFQVLIKKITEEMLVYPQTRNEDITIQFKEPPKIIQSLKGFDIKEISGNHENYNVKAYNNKLVISGMINENTIDKIDGLVRANLVY